MIGKYIVFVEEVGISGIPPKKIDVNDINNQDSRATILFKYLCEINEIVPEK